MQTPGLPEDIKKRVEAGRSRMRDGAPRANECLRFWRGEHYVFTNKDNELVTQGTRVGEKEPYRVRQTRNLLVDIVAQLTSAMTSRIPGYEVNPSTTDPEDVGAARLANKVAFYGYDKWDIYEASVRAVEYAIVTGEGFVWPYFDNTVGDAIDDEVATGEIRLRVYGRNEVFWEAGQRFQDSRWIAVEQAMPISEVKQMAGYLGGELMADGTTSDSSDQSQVGDSVLVCHVLERPGPSNGGKGRWFTLANERQIIKERPYPCLDGEGRPLDEPVIHKLSYFLDPELDRDMGLVEHLLDPSRTYDDCTNKQLEWKNLALSPQMIGPPGAVRTKLSSKPGLYIEAIPINGVLPKWREVPSIPPELSVIKQEAARDMQQIAGQDQLPNQIESGKGVQAFYGTLSQRDLTFLGFVAKFHARLMRHCLYLVQRHYTEPRLLTIRGRFGTETIPDFMGANLHGQADVTVLPGTIEPRTRQVIEQRVMTWAQLGWISPQAAMTAINNGTAQGLVESYELDISRAHLTIRKLKNFASGAPGDEQLPEPRKKIDNYAVHRSIISDWAKTTDFDSERPEVQEATMTYLEALDWLEQQEAAEKAAAMAMDAQALGTQNAAKDQTGTPMPSLPAVPA